MRLLRQALVVFAVNLKTINQRLGSSLVVVAGIAGVVGVMVSVLALGNGLQQSFAATGRPDRAIVVAKGAFGESGSLVSADAALTIASASAKDGAGGATFSREFLAQIPLVAQADHVSKNVALRGVERGGLALRPEIRIVQGRMFQPGLHEVIIGRSLQSQFRNLTVGGSVPVQKEPWRIVGSFESGGGMHDSEIIGDTATLLSAYHRTGYQSVLVRLAGTAALNVLEKALAANPSLSVEAHREDQYFADQSKGIVRLLKALGYFVGGIMAVGATFAALNTMYAAVNAQLLVIATLRALGFRASAVLTAIFLESFLLALAGAFLGTAIAWLLFSGHTINMLGSSGNQSVFTLHITLSMLVLGAVWSIAIGFAGGLFPALRAARMPVATALREL